METIKVLIVDEHPLAREGIKAMLQTDPGIRVVGQAQDGQEAIAKVLEYQPDIVLMDLQVPKIDGLQATRYIKARRPDVEVIILTMYHNEAFVVDALQAGARAYILRDASTDLLCHTIRAVHSGGISFKGSLVWEAMANLLVSGRGPRQDVAALMREKKLTQRELEVLGLLSNGQTNKQIARKLVIAEETAKKHVQNIMGKMGASDRTQAAVMAVRSGLVN